MSAATAQIASCLGLLAVARPAPSDTHRPVIPDNTQYAPNDTQYAPGTPLDPRAVQLRGNATAPVSASPCCKGCDQCQVQQLPVPCWSRLHPASSGLSGQSVPGPPETNRRKFLS